MAFGDSSPAVMRNRYYLNAVPNVVTSHLLAIFILKMGLVCNAAEQIESASQLKHHTYLIWPVIQGYALLPLHNNLSMFVTQSPRWHVSIIILPIVNQSQLHLLVLLFFSLFLCCLLFLSGDLAWKSSHYSHNWKCLKCKCSHSQSQGTRAKRLSHCEFFMLGSNAFLLKSARQMLMLLWELMKVLAYKHLVIHYRGSQQPATAGLFFNCKGRKGRTSCFN